jgi:acyl-coenzyme A synthetase/AMP-(fatty) acid ligase
MFVTPSEPDDGTALTARIQDRIKSQLSIYKCPRNIRIVTEIPRTATGKIQRFRLREIAGEAAPLERNRPAEVTARRADRTAP